MKLQPWQVFGSRTLTFHSSLAGFRVKRNQPAFGRAEEDLATAHCYAAVLEAEQRFGLDRVQLGDVASKLIAGGGVERICAVGRGAVIDEAVEHDQAGLQALGDLAWRVNSGHLELADVAPVDLLQRAVAPAAPVAVVAGSVVAGQLIGGGDADGGQTCRHSGQPDATEGAHAAIEV